MEEIMALYANMYASAYHKLKVNVPFTYKDQQILISPPRLNWKLTSCHICMNDAVRAHRQCLDPRGIIVPERPNRRGVETADNTGGGESLSEVAGGVGAFSFAEFDRDGPWR